MFCPCPSLGHGRCQILHTDASEVAKATILHQEQLVGETKKLKVIAYDIKVLSESEMRYGSPKVEMLAVVYFSEKFRSHLTGGQFTLRVYNMILALLPSFGHGLVGRWIAMLDQYDMKIVHGGKDKHTNALCHAFDGLENC